MRFRTRTISAAVLGLVLGACGQQSATPAHPTTVSPTVAPTAATSSPSAATPTAAADAPATAAADAPEGWKRITVEEQGISIAVPEEWQELSADVIGDSGVMEQLLEANPDALVALQQAQTAIESGQIALFAFDAAEPDDTGFATNLNVINVGPVEGTAEQAAERVAESIRQEIPVVGEVESETTRLPSGDAAVLAYEWQVDDGAGTVTTVSVSQYAIIADSGTGFILSLSAASEAADAYEDIFRQIAESFREEPS